MRIPIAALALVLLAITLPARAETSEPVPGAPHPPNLWLEAGLALGPYYWRTTTTYVSSDEPAPDEHYGQSATMVGGALSLNIGGWLGRHAALGGFMRFAVAGGVAQPGWQRGTGTLLLVEWRASLLLALERTRGLRLLLSGGLAAQVDAGMTVVEPALGPAAGVEAGYALPIGRHALVFGLGASFALIFSTGQGDHGEYRNRDYVVMPEATVRFLL